MTNGTTRENRGKILVAYYSLSGNTARVARDIAARTGADIESIHDDGHGVGIFGFLKDSLDAMRGIPAKIRPPAKDPADYALVIVGTPVWAGKMTPAIRAYLQQTRGRSNNVAFFTTSGNTAVAKVAPSLESLSDTRAIAWAGFNARELGEQGVYEAKLSAFLSNIQGRYASPAPTFFAQARAT